MAEKFDQSKYIQAYMKEHYSRIEIKCKPEIKEQTLSQHCPNIVPIREI